jgi:hypothetical protein
MESIFLRKVRKVAEDYDAKLPASDPRFQREVTLIHEDGSVVHYNSAFLMKMADSHVSLLTTENSFWIICFTEHHGLHIDHSDDLLLYWESERRHQTIEELTP